MLIDECSAGAEVSHSRHEFPGRGPGDCGDGVPGVPKVMEMEPGHPGFVTSGEPGTVAKVAPADGCSFQQGEDERIGLWPDVLGEMRRKFWDQVRGEGHGAPPSIRLRWADLEPPIGQLLQLFDHGHGPSYQVEPLPGETGDLPETQTGECGKVSPSRDRRFHRLCEEVDLSEVAIGRSLDRSLPAPLMRHGFLGMSPSSTAAAIGWGPQDRCLDRPGPAPPRPERVELPPCKTAHRRVIVVGDGPSFRAIRDGGTPPMAKTICHTKTNEEKLVYHSNRNCEEYKNIEPANRVYRDECEVCARLNNS